MSERDDASKRLVLARRAKFVAAAVAGIAIGCGKESKPQPCLSESVLEPDAAPPPQPCLAPPPQPCLSMYIPPDSGAPFSPPKKDGGK